MTQFNYKAVDRRGATVTGSVEAVDRRSAVALLTDKGQFVTEMMEGLSESSRGVKIHREIPQRWSWGRRVSRKEVVAMTTQFSTALRAGLPLLSCLELLRDQQKKAGLRQILDDLVESVSSGQSLSDALAHHPTVFGPLYLSMIRVGETGGILEDTTAQLAQILNRDDHVKTTMKNASAYPLFVLVLGMVSVTVIVTVILPKIMNSLDMGRDMMPWPTRLLLTISDHLRSVFSTVPGWIILVAVVLGLTQGLRWLRTEGRLGWDGFKLKIPILGNVLRSIAVGRFSRTLGALTRGGVTIMEALAVVRDTLGNEALGRQIDHVAEEVKRGEALGPSVDRTGLFPPLLIQILAVGEQTGKLDELLLNAAETFDTESDAAIARFMAIFPALLILILALLIGFIIIATLLPMVTMQFSAIGS